MITLYWVWWSCIATLAFSAYQGCVVFLLPHPWRDEDGGKQ